MLAEMGDLVSPGSHEAALLADLDSGRMPKHVAVIMDGNGRWAGSRGFERIEGHRRGAETARLIIELNARLSIPYLTLYTFSSENWKRPSREVNALMGMLYDNLELKAELLKKHNIRLKVLGERGRLPRRLAAKLKQTEEMSRTFDHMVVNLALNYGGRQEIIHAVRSLVQEGLSPENITEDVFRKALYTRDDPDPDLVIRTSGEIRLSNFLIFQSAYAELYFAPQMWPDFRVAPFLEALTDYQQRQRRFGGI